jgi:putative FmdB family regulatory protein
MPLFEYLCGSCGKKVELLLSRGETPVCKYCGGKQLEKQFSTFSSSSNTKNSHNHGGGCGCCAKRDSCPSA